MNHYEALGIDRSATPEQIKKAYKRMAAKHHPDRVGGDTRAMVRINQAHKALSDPAKRAYYDLHGEEEKLTTPEQQALTAIFQILLTLTEQAGVDFDFVAAVAENLKHNRVTVASKRTELEKMLTKTEKQRKRIRRKKQDTPNLLDQLFQQKVDACKAQIAAIPQALATIDKALEILGDYESPASAREPRIFGLEEVLKFYGPTR